MLSDHVDKLLVVGPINCAKSWRDEYSEVSYESDNHGPLCLINDDNICSKKDVLSHDYRTSRIIIVNYELIPKISDILKTLVDSKTMIVFDEIHRIKKIDNEKYIKLKEIVFNTKYRIALTGTPLPNGYIDLYNMISLLHDEYTSIYFQMYESSLKSDDFLYKKSGLQNSNLNSLLYPFFMRIDKKDLKVPPAEPDHLIQIQTNEYEKNLFYRIMNMKFNSFESTIKLVEIGCVPYKCEQDIEKLDELTISNGSNVRLTSKLCKFLSILKKNNRKEKK